MYCLLRKYSPGCKSGTVGFTQAGHEAVLGGLQIWQRGTVRMCDMSGNLRGVDYFWSLWKRDWKRFVSGYRHASKLQGHVKQRTAPCFTRRLFALGIIFQLAWHVREAALPRKPVQHSKQTRALWQPPA